MKNIKNISNIIAIILIVTPLIIMPTSIFADYFYLPKISFIYMMIVIISAIHLMSPEKKRIELDSATKLLLIYLGLVILATIFSIDPLKSIMGANRREEGLITIISYGFLFLFAKTYYQFRPWHLKGIIVTSFLVAIYAFIQYFGYDFIPRDMFRRGHNWDTWVFSTIGNPNFLGSYLLLHISIFIYLFLEKKKMIFFWMATLLQATIVITLTRGVWLGFMVLLIIYLIYSIKNKKSIIEYVLMIALFGIITFSLNYSSDGEYTERFASIKYETEEVSIKNDNYQRSGSSRIYVWLKTSEMILERPLLGHGLETMDPMFMIRYKDDMRETIGGVVRFDRAHNEYLHIAFSSGIPALIFYLSFLGACLISGIKKGKENKYYYAIAFAIISYLVAALFNISVVSVAYIFWIYLGILMNKESFKKCKIDND